MEIGFLVTIAKNTEIEVLFSNKKEKSFSNIREENVILEYVYNDSSKKIEKLIFDKPLELGKKRLYENTYDIDKDTECINGSIWVKKYGARTDDDCDWKEIK